MNGSRGLLSVVLLSLHFNGHFPGGPGLAGTSSFTGKMPFLLGPQNPT